MKILNIFLKYIASSVILLTINFQTFADSQEESHELIKQVVMNFTKENIQSNSGERVNIDVGYIDNRLNLAHCTIPLEPFSANTNNTANMIIGVRCDGIQPWKIYVPVRIAIYKKVVVADNTLLKGTILSEDDLRLSEQNITNLKPGFYTNKTDLIGKVLTRSTNSDLVLTRDYVENPVLIQRGQMVTVIAKKGNLEVKTHGIALSKGRAGDLIAIKNTQSKRIIEGTVISGQLVEIYLS